MNHDKITQKRFLAAGLDWIIIGLLSRYLSILLSKIEFISLAFEIAELQLIFHMFFWCGKDFLFKNASLGKKICGLCVVKKSGYPPSPKKLIFRNMLSVFLFPFELYRLFVAKDERYGDVLAKTKVIYNSEQFKNKTETENTSDNSMF